MLQLLQEQTVKFDTHQAGDGREIDNDALHMHKRMNGKKFKGVHIRIPLNSSGNITYSGNNSKIANQIIKEVKSVFKKDSAKVTEMAKSLAKNINRYSKDMSSENSLKFLEDSAKTIAKHFELKEEITGRLVSEAKNHYISSFITTHRDNNNKIYYIKQDVHRKSIKIGDNIEKLFYGNNKSKDNF